MFDKSIYHEDRCGTQTCFALDYLLARQVLTDRNTRIGSLNTQSQAHTPLFWVALKDDKQKPTIKYQVTYSSWSITPSSISRGGAKFEVHKKWILNSLEVSWPSKPARVNKKLLCSFHFFETLPDMSSQYIQSGRAAIHFPWALACQWLPRTGLVCVQWDGMSGDVVFHTSEKIVRWGYIFMGLKCIPRIHKGWGTPYSRWSSARAGKFFRKSFCETSISTSSRTCHPSPSDIEIRQSGHALQ